MIGCSKTVEYVIVCLISSVGRDNMVGAVGYLGSSGLVLGNNRGCGWD